MRVVENISDETVRLTLKKGISSHGSTSSGVSPRTHLKTLDVMRKHAKWMKAA
jgi:hypothetical protein